jgi:hypothetical protein
MPRKSVEGGDDIGFLFERSKAARETEKEIDSRE